MSANWSTGASRSPSLRGIEPMKSWSPLALLGALGLALAACTAEPLAPAAIAASDPLAAPAAGEWPSDGRDYTAQR